jgi:hypothetical protein
VICCCVSGTKRITTGKRRCLLPSPIRLSSLPVRLAPVVEKFRPGLKHGMHSGMHLKKGVTGRLRSAFSGSEQELCVQKFTPWLERMGYLP